MRDVVYESGFVRVERALNHEASSETGVMQQQVLSVSDLGKILISGNA